MARQFLLEGSGLNHKTGKDVRFKIPASIAPATVRAISESLLVESFIHEKKEYTMEETGPLRFSVFILERIQRTPEHEALLKELRLEIAMLEAMCKSPEVESQSLLSMANGFRNRGMDFLAEAAEAMAQEVISKGKKFIS
jgi:hypothetical protein